MSIPAAVYGVLMFPIAAVFGMIVRNRKVLVADRSRPKDRTGALSCGGPRPGTVRSGVAAEAADHLGDAR